MDLIAKKPVRYAGRNYLPGARISTRTDKDAKALKLLGKAEDAPLHEVASTGAPRRAAEPVVAPAPEPPPEPEPAAVVEPELAAETPAPRAPSRGRYGRRDLRAED